MTQILHRAVQLLLAPLWAPLILIALLCIVLIAVILCPIHYIFTGRWTAETK